MAGLLSGAVFELENCFCEFKQVSAQNEGGNG